MVKYKFVKDISWYSCSKKRPITYSTIAVSDSIKNISEYLNEPITPNNILNYINKNNLIAYEEKDVLLKYIELGFGDEVLNLL